MLSKLSLFCVCLAVLISPLFFSSTSYSFQNEPTAFRGIQFGTDLTKSPGMELIVKGKRIDYFKKPTDKLHIAAADITDIVYCSTQNQFHSVMIKLNGYVNFTELKESLFQLYGPGQPTLEGYTWKGKTVGINMGFNEVTGDGYLTYTYFPVMEKEEAKARERVKDAASDL